MLLHDKYTAFGKIIEGQDKADAIGRSPTSAPGRPTQPAVIRSIKVLTPKTYVLPKLVKNDAGNRSKKDGK